MAGIRGKFTLRMADIAWVKWPFTVPGIEEIEISLGCKIGTSQGWILQNWREHFPWVQFVRLGCGGVQFWLDLVGIFWGGAHSPRVSLV